MNKKMRLPLLHVNRSKMMALTLACALLGGASALAAPREVTGTVVDAEGEPLVGATVTVVGTNKVTATDLDGKYSIQADPGQALKVTYIGCSPKEEKVSAAGAMNFTLAENTQELEEVVVVGYGTVKKKDMTGAVAAVKGEKLADRKVTTLSRALQGSVAGVQVTRTGSAPGAGASIQVRGVTSIGETSPLIIVDGSPINSIDYVNANDVESITVLKDAASAAIYGARAAAGVVLITTKRADESTIKLNYNFEYGLDIVKSLPQNVSAQRHLELTNELYYNDQPNAGWYQAYTQDQVENWMERHLTDPDNYPVTDWPDYMIKKSKPHQRHVITLTGGSKKVKSRVSLSYDRDDGLFKEAMDRYERYMVRTNNDFTFNKYIKAGADINVYYRESDRPNYVGSVWSQMFKVPAIFTPRWANGTLSDVKDGSSPYGPLLYGGRNKSNGIDISGRFSVEITPIDGLRLQAVFAPEMIYSGTKQMYEAVPWYNSDDPENIAGYMSGDYQRNKLEESRSQVKRFTGQLIAQYSKTFGKHDVSLMVGYEDYYNRHESFGATSDFMEFSIYPYMASANKNFLTVSGTAYENAYQSYFGRFLYSFDNRYMLQVNFRRDGSSRFHKDYRWGNYPSVSAGWNISNEKFMKNLDPRGLSYLKLRASWGRLGNERGVGNYPYITEMSFTNAAMYPSADATVSQYVQAANINNYGIPNISWETTESYDIGIDASFLNSRLRLSADYYRKDTKDMLLSLQIPVFLGFANPKQNAGKMHTNGWDLELGWNDRVGDVSYSVAFNLSDYQSKMGDLKGTEFSGDQMSREGSYYNEWYGYVAEGLWQSWDELNAVDENGKKTAAVINASTKPGDVKYKDINGDGVITPDQDRILLGNSLPRFLFGGNASLQWKGIDFSFAFQGVGKKTDRLNRNMVEGYRSQWGAFPAIAEGKYWSWNNTAEQNAKATFPRWTKVNNDSNYALSTWWLIKGSYFRMSNITLGYTLPQELTRKAFIDKLRVYVATNDPFCIHHYPKGFDPEATLGSYPITTSVLFGLNVSF